MTLGTRAGSPLGVEAVSELTSVEGLNALRRPNRCMASITASCSQRVMRRCLLGVLANVATEMSLHVLAYNVKRAVAVLGIPALMAAIRG